MTGQHRRFRFAFRPFAGFLRWLFPLILATLACGAPQYFTSTDESNEAVAEVGERFDGTSGTVEEVVQRTAEEAGMSLEEALNTPAEDHRGRVLELMGPPDTFRLTFQELEGSVVRWEEWAYYDLGARFDFVDGQLLWTVELEPIPGIAIYAHFYDPRDFTADMSPDQARALLTGQELAEMDMAEGELPGGLFLGADQLLLGFDQNRLVYAESLYLTPEEVQ